MCGKYEWRLAERRCGGVSAQVCGLQLTLKTFCRAAAAPSDAGGGGGGSAKEIYCRTHVPKMSATSVGGDAVGIRAALDAQKQASDKVK